MAKSKRKRQKRARRAGGHPAGRTPAQSVRSVRGEQERLAELVVAEARRRAQEALAPETAPERVAALIVQEFENLPTPPGLTLRLTREGSEERARAVAAEIARLAPGSVTALTLDAEVARELDHEEERARELLDQALDAYLDPDGTVSLARHMLVAGRQLDALGLARDVLTEDPEDEDANEVYGWVLEQWHERFTDVGKLGRAERDELAHFADREALYALRDAMRDFVETRRPELQGPVAASVREWMEELRGAQDDDSTDAYDLESGDDERSEALLRFAIEHAWLMESDEDADVPQDHRPAETTGAPDEADAPLALLASDADTDPEIARLARDWLETVTYGLWQVVDPVPAPGLWLTDIVTGARRYVAVPPEQLPGISRWSVLLGALVSLDGVWMSTGAVVLLRPSEGDQAAEWAHDASAAVAKALAGKRARHTNRRRDPEPHGVLIEAAEPMDPMVAALMSQVIGTLLPEIVGEVWRRRADGPKLANTEGHPLRVITAHLAVNDPANVTHLLAAHADFRTEDEGELSWWGRELTAGERADALAQIKALVGEDETVEETDQPQRWLRGRLAPTPDGFEVTVNSDQRLKALIGVLADLGAEPKITRQSVIDPAQDLPPIQLGAPMPFGASQDAIDAWQSLWVDERVPALKGATPRAASRRLASRPRLEAVLRTFEHDAYRLAQANRPAPDIDQLRAELGMDTWWEPAPRSDERP